jgi:phosphate:Na+ symporter
MSVRWSFNGAGQDGDWRMWTFLTVGGGVALILFGVRFLRKGLDRLFGPKLGTWMNRLARDRIRAFFTGLGISVLAPSSTTISVLAVSAVQAGHLSARQMFAVMIGADIGLTAMILLISMRIDSFAPVLILIGVLLFQFTNAEKLRGIGQTIISLGFMFQGIFIIKSAVSGIEGNGDLVQLIHIAEHYPFLLAVLAAVMAIALQSSTATIALVIALGATDTITLPIGVAVVAGANVGIAFTTMFVGWRQIESRRLALANLLAKCSVALIVLSLLPHVAAMLERLPGGMDQHVAYAHTGFNVLLAAIFLPLVVPMDRLVDRIVPDRPATAQMVFGPRHIKGAHFDSTALALGMSLKEILHAGELVRAMLADVWRALKHDDLELAKHVSEMDNRVDLLDGEIKRFLTRALSFDGDASDSAEQMRQLRYLNELETIGDIIDKNISELVVKKARLHVDFTREGWAELDDFHSKVSENLLIAETVFTTRDMKLAQSLMNHKEYIRTYERELRDRHFARLKDRVDETHETSAIHLDLLTYLKRINSHVTHVAYAIITDG